MRHMYTINRYSYLFKYIYIKSWRILWPVQFKLIVIFLRQQKWCWKKTLQETPVSDKRRCQCGHDIIDRYNSVYSVIDFNCPRRPKNVSFHLFMSANTLPCWHLDLSGWTVFYLSYCCMFSLACWLANEDSNLQVRKLCFIDIWKWQFPQHVHTHVWTFLACSLQGRIQDFHIEADSQRLCARTSSANRILLRPGSRVKGPGSSRVLDALSSNLKSFILKHSGTKLD